MPSDSGGLRFVRPDLSAGVRGSSARGNQPQCRVPAEQGAAVDGVERSGQSADGHHHAGKNRSSMANVVTVCHSLKK